MSWSTGPTLFLATHPVRHRNVVLFARPIVYALGMGALAWSPRFELALCAAAFAALGGPMTDLMILMIIQTEFPSDRIGKVFSLRLALSRGSFGLGLLAAAPLYELFPVRHAITLAMGGLLVFALLAFVQAATARLPTKQS